MGKAGGVELAATGPLHIPDEVLKLADEDKQILKDRLAAEMRVRFDPNLPLLVYMVTFGNNAEEADRGLIRLSRYANIVVKTRKNVTSVAAYSKAKSATIFFAHDGRLNWLMRYAADAVLADPFGVAATTANLVGLKYIIVNTDTMQPGGLSPLIPFSQWHDNNKSTIQNLLCHFVSPININATDMIVERLHDATYWERFERDMPKVREAVFGNYWIGDAAVNRAADYIRNVLDRGTFEPEGLAGSHWETVNTMPSFDDLLSKCSDITL